MARFIVKRYADGRSERIDLDDAVDIGQETPEQHAARIAAPKPLTVEQRLAALEAEVTELKRKP